MRNEPLLVIIEKIALALVVVIWLLRAGIGPSLNYILLFSTTLLAIFYLWFGFFVFNKLSPNDLLNQRVRSGLTAFSVFSGILSGFIVSYVLVAIILGFLFFPMKQTAMVFAFILILLSGVWFGIYHWRCKAYGDILKRYVWRVGILLVFVTLLLFTPLDLRLKILFRDYPDFQEAYLEYRGNPECEQALERVREERSRFR